MFTDPGVDDALALSMICSADRVSIIGACGSAGNVPAPQSTRNLSHLVSLSGLDFPVFEGRNLGPARPMFDGRIAHGRWGLGSFRSPAPRRRPRDYRALKRFLLTFEKFSILCTGPMTDLAPLLEDQSLRPRIERVTAMGGSASVGNVTPTAEFNIRFNPTAAAKVFSSGINLQMVTLDLTQSIRFHAGDLNFLNRGEAPIRAVLRDAVSHYFKFHRRYEGFYGCYVHDPTAAAAAIWPQMFAFTAVPARVETSTGLTYGTTVFDRRYRSRRSRSTVSLTSAHHTESVKSRMLQLLRSL
jgi:purine nucleosidase